MSTGQPRILVVEDDAEICILVEDYLRRAAFDAVVARNGQEMNRVLAEQDVDAIILDLNLPDADGLDLCRKIRAERDTPIIILTARGDPVDKVIGLELGADDYLAKPFEPLELIARIKSILRRSARQEAPPSQSSAHYQFSGWSLSIDHRALFDPNGRMIALSNAEYRLLKIFLDHAGQTLSREKLLQLGAGEFGAAHDRAVDLQVSRLRSKLRCDGSPAGFIQTIRQEGYCFTAEIGASP